MAAANSVKAGAPEAEASEGAAASEVETWVAKTVEALRAGRLAVVWAVVEVQGGAAMPAAMGVAVSLVNAEILRMAMT